jgi:tetratricopeptide (TPR) repeat protein
MLRQTASLATPSAVRGSTRWVVFLAALCGALAIGLASACSADQQPQAVQSWLQTDHLTGLEKRLFQFADANRFQRFTLLEATLVASGASDDAELSRYVALAADKVLKLRNLGTMVGSPKEKAAIAFAYLHSEILRGGYDLQCTDLRQTLDCGRFNCVSATVLYNYLASEFGLEACALESPGHAMSRLTLPSDPKRIETLDVETTCPQWFRWIAQPPEHREEIEKSLGSNYHRHEAGRAVGDRQLVAMIYYNAGVDMLSQRRFAEAVSDNVKALWLDPNNETVRGNFLASINNWAIALASLHRYPEAAELLTRGLATEPNYKPFRLNYEHLRSEWNETMSKEGRTENADLRAEDNVQ